jgi:hypothetical protein
MRAAPLPRFAPRHRPTIARALLLAAVATGCDNPLPTPEVEGVVWHVQSQRYGCAAYEQAPGDYLPSQFNHEPAGSNFCDVANMLFNCRDVSYAQAFSFSDSVSDDPGPWHREYRQSYTLYDDPGGGALDVVGSGMINFTSIVLSAHTNVGSNVEAMVGAAWSIAPSQNDSVTSAAIDYFDEGLSTTASHAFTIDGPYPPRAVVWGEAFGDYGGFPFVPFALSSGGFSAAGTITAEFNVCQEVRLYNDDEQCIYAPGGVSAAAPCGSFSTVAVHVHAETGEFVLLDFFSFQCLTVDDSTPAADVLPVTRQDCSAGIDDMQQWAWFEDGTLRPNGATDWCLAPNPEEEFTVDTYPEPVTYAPMVVEPCTVSAAQRWNFF